MKAAHALEQNLLETIIARDNVLRAWQRVKLNKGAAGVDALTIAEFPQWARQYWPDIKSKLCNTDYQPSAVRRVWIPKPNGELRPLGIPTITDRIIQQAIAQQLTPQFEREFSDNSYGFRAGRNAHQAVRQVREYIRAKYRFIVDIDLAAFFDNVNHDVLMRLLANRVKDKRVLQLIGRYLRAGVVVDGEHQATPKGVPQGGPLSPLLANIVLHELDVYLHQCGHKFARYADDFVICVRSERAAKRVRANVTRFLEKQLKLNVNENKSRVCSSNELEFLGFTFKRNKIVWSDKALHKFKHQIRQLTGRSWGVSLDYRYRELRLYVVGWMNYFALSEYYRPIPELDEWLRRRMRCCYWKMWRWPRTKIKHLLSLGVSEKEAIKTGVSSKGPHTMSRTPITQMAMTNEWLAEQGLVSIRQQWINFHYPASTA